MIIISKTLVNYGILLSSDGNSDLMKIRSIRSLACAISNGIAGGPVGVGCDGLRKPRGALRLTIASGTNVRKYTLPPTPPLLRTRTRFKGNIMEHPTSEALTCRLTLISRP